MTTDKKPNLLIERREAGMMDAKEQEADFIDREELKEKLDRGDDFKLVMVLGEWEYRAKRISGSLRVSTPEEGLQALDPNDEIVLYYSGLTCPASRMACRFLKAHGYEHMRRYPGGLEEWENAGYPLEGEQVFASSAAWFRS
jgi:rhodanese-related sulfurtransferase